MSKTVTITLELTPEQAAGLKRFAEKFTHTDATAVLYPHVSPDVRNEQASSMTAAFYGLNRALADADVSSWPWIETGRP